MAAGEMLARAKRAEENAERLVKEAEGGGTAAERNAACAQVWATLALAARVGDVSESVKGIRADGVGVG